MGNGSHGAEPIDVARLASRIAVGVAIFALLGIALGVSGRPGIVVELEHPLSIRTGSAVACLLLALALLGWLRTMPIHQGARAGCIALALVAASSSLVATSGQLHAHLTRSIDDHQLHAHAVPVLTSACVLLLSFALAALEFRAPIAFVDGFACLSFAVSAFVLFAWGIGDPGALVVGREEPPLFLGALAFAALALATIMAAPERDGLGALIGRRGAGGGTVLRRFVPVALLVPLGLEVARHQLVRSLDVNVNLVVTTQVFATAMLLVAFVVFGAVRLDRTQRELRAAREAAFMSTLSHELRTPLIAIRNLAEVVDGSWDDVSDEQKRETNRATLAQSTRLLDLIHDTWQLRRLDAGTLPASAQGVSLREALREAVRERGMHVAIECPPTLQVWMDPEHLRLMLGACLRLAQRSGPGPKTLRAQARETDACVYVELPTNAGVVASPPAESSWSLWTIAQFARQWGGDASFERVDDERSRFVVSLPLAARLPN